MARHTKVLIAALATALIAGLGVTASGPATGVAPVAVNDHQWCC